MRDDSPRWQSSPAAQIGWGLEYITRTYGGRRRPRAALRAAARLPGRRPWR